MRVTVGFNGGPVVSVYEWMRKSRSPLIRTVVRKELRMLNRSVAMTIIVSILVVGIARSQSKQTATARPDTATVFVGQEIEDAKRVLKSRSIEHGEGGFAFAEGDPDESNLFAVLEIKRVYACIYYSKSQAQVTGLDLVFSPAHQAGKACESWVSARKLVLNGDGSYSVLFAPPASQGEPQAVECKKPESQLPRSSN